MQNYIITCRSGVKALVRAEDAASANEQWDDAVERGDAEPRIAGMTVRAAAREVAACVRAGHDYR